MTMSMEYQTYISKLYLHEISSSHVFKTYCLGTTIKVTGEFLAMFLLLFEQKRALITASLIFLA